jgi:Helix-turn-helix domain
MKKSATAPPADRRPPVSETRAAKELMGCSPSHLRELRNRGLGPPYYRVGKVVRYRPAECERWLEGYRVEPLRRRA